MHTLKDQRPCSRRRARGNQRVAGLMGRLALVAVLIVAVATSAPVQAAVLHCPSGDVTCLVTAINTANGTGEGDTITLEAGTYTLTTVDNDTDGPNGLPSITSPLTITGAGAETTIIARDPNAPRFRLLHVMATGTLIMDGVTLTGGGDPAIVDPEAGESFGGGLFNAGGVELLHCRVTGNRVFTGDTFGGGIYNAGVMTIADSLIANNSAWFLL